VALEIPPAWERLTLASLDGVVLVVGAPDTGKSTFARYLYRRLHEHHERVAFVDGDIGQATLGPPTTMTLALGNPGDDSFPPAGPCYRVFVGSVSPRGHMLPTIVGAHRLVQKAREEGTTAIVFDTTGLVDPAQGGGELKRAKVDLLRPTVVVGIQRGNELEHLLLPLRRSQRTRVIDLPAARAACRREVTERQEHRAAAFRRYFESAHILEMAWQRLAVFPYPAFTLHRLAALEDQDGFALALGLILVNDPARGLIALRTPLASLERVDTIHLGALVLDPDTFCQ
jgi:polynucleotide 5'-hydroxyl-kinase GRC3/NOL9